MASRTNASTAEENVPDRISRLQDPDIQEKKDDSDTIGDLEDNKKDRVDGKEDDEEDDDDAYDWWSDSVD